MRKRDDASSGFPNHTKVVDNDVINSIVGKTQICAIDQILEKKTNKQTYSSQQDAHISQAQFIRSTNKF